jgi:hypothetical protein
MASLGHVFGPATEAFVRSSGFCQRRSALSGLAFVQGLVFGWLHDPQARVADLAHAIGCAGCAISPQALQQRFSPQGAALLYDVLTKALPTRVGSEWGAVSGSRDASPTVLPGHFARVWLQDSTVIPLPKALSPLWPGGSGASALKVQVRLDLQSGTLAAPLLVPGHVHDLKASRNHEVPQANELHIADLGYFDLQRLRTIQEHQGFFLSRLRATTTVNVTSSSTCHSPQPTPPPLLSRRLQAVAPHVNQVDWSVTVGANNGVVCRLLAVRVPPSVAAQRRVALAKESKRKAQAQSDERTALCAWTILITNAPASRLSLAQALALYGARWQIERVFRLWKETLGLTHWRGAAPYRILCEVYAKLLGAWVAHTLLPIGMGAYPQRSLARATRALCAHALALLHALRQPNAYTPLLQTFLKTLPKCAITQKKRRKPATFQRLHDAMYSLA